MAYSLAQVEVEALQLSAEDRVRLADHLLASVSPDAEVEQAWSEEVERRLAEAEAGAAFTPLEDAVARARKAIT